MESKEETLKREAGGDMAFVSCFVAERAMQAYADHATAALREENDRLRNPWVSVKTTLPEFGKEVLVINGSFTEIASYKTTKKWRNASTGDICDFATYWCE